MKAFKFSLAPVLQQRQWEEDLRKKELAAVHQKINRTREMLLAMDAKQAECHQSLSRATAGTVDVHDVRLHHRYLQHLAKEIQRVQLMLEKLKTEAARRREELVGAMRERKKIDKLREIELGQFHHQVKIFEQKAIDEASIARYLHEQQA